MKTSLIIFALSLTFLFIQTNRAEAEYKSGNTRYQMLHIKQMAKRGFTNNGHSKYVYSKTTEANMANKQTALQTTHLSQNSKVRELHIGIDVQKKPRIKRVIGKKKISIANVSGGGNSLKKVNVLINSKRTLRF